MGSSLNHRVLGFQGNKVPWVSDIRHSKILHSRICFIFSLFFKIAIPLSVTPQPFNGVNKISDKNLYTPHRTASAIHKAPK